MAKKKKKLGRKLKYGKPIAAIKLSLSPEAWLALNQVKKGSRSEYISILILNAPRDIREFYEAFKD